MLQSNFNISDRLNGKQREFIELRMGFSSQRWWRTFGSYDIDMNPRHLHPLLIITKYCILFIWDHSVALQSYETSTADRLFFIHLNRSRAQYTSFHEPGSLADRLWFEIHFHYAHLLRVFVYEVFSFFIKSNDKRRKGGRLIGICVHVVCYLLFILFIAFICSLVAAVAQINGFNLPIRQNNIYSVFCICRSFVIFWF